MKISGAEILIFMGAVLAAPTLFAPLTPSPDAVTMLPFLLVAAVFVVGFFAVRRPTRKIT